MINSHAMFYPDAHSIKNKLSDIKNSICWNMINQDIIAISESLFDPPIRDFVQEVPEIKLSEQTEKMYYPKNEKWWTFFVEQRVFCV